jgi:outer membrane lipase/esterase
MGTAGAELATYVKTRLVANGAARVVVLNLPDVSLTPFALTLDASTQALVNQMSTTYNAQLAAGLSGGSNVLLTDAYTTFRDQIANPGKYGLSDVTTPACDLTKTIIPSSLVCSATTLIAGDTSRFQFSDPVHPTPYGHQLLFNGAVSEMIRVGWL